MFRIEQGLLRLLRMKPHRKHQSFVRNSWYCTHLFNSVLSITFLDLSVEIGRNVGVHQEAMISVNSFFWRFPTVATLGIGFIMFISFRRPQPNYQNRDETYSADYLKQTCSNDK